MKIDNNLTMSSREIADLVNTTHDSVMKTIRSLVSKGVVFGNETPYTHPQNHQTYKEFVLDFRNTMVVVSGYNSELRAKVIDRWQELEKQAKVGFTIPQTFAQALMLAATQAAQIEEQQKQLEVATPKVEFVDKYVDTKGNLTFREVAKLLKVNERRFRHFLKDNKIMYELHDGWAGYSKFIKNGMIENVTGFNKDTGRAFSTALFTPKGFNYIAGFWKDGK